MLELPRIPYKMSKNKSQPISMRGINYTNVLSDGDVADSKGISARSYPYITTRERRDEKGDYAGATAITVFQGEFVYVKGNELHWGDKSWVITPGRKLFTQINSKLVIMPDQKYIDGEDNTLKDMGAHRYIEGQFTKNGITATSAYSTSAEGYNLSASGVRLNYIPYKAVTVNAVIYLVKFHPGNDITGEAIGPNIYYEQHYVRFSKELPLKNKVIFYKVEGTRKSEDNIWTSEYYFELSQDDYDVLKDELTVGESIMGRGTGTISSFTINKIDGKTYYTRIPDYNGNCYCEWMEKTIPNSVIYNELGIGAGCRARFNFSKNPGILCDFSVELEGDGRISRPYSSYPGSRYSCEISNEGVIADIPRNFHPGDSVRIVTRDGAQILTVAEVGESYIDFEEEITLDIDEYSDRVELQRLASLFAFSVGDAVTISGSSANDMTFIISEIGEDTLYAENEIFTATSEVEYFNVDRKIPDLDFICESNNRIWGCSNADNTIYASALGDPTNFFDYSGESTDSYAVAVGSPERFTACCRYGDSVIFFKEMKVHKILGSYPSEYTLYSYDIEGVQSGCEKSLQVINEVLYYKGIHGVFAFTGSPSLISAQLGEKKFSGAVAGNDGDTLYISMTDGERDYLFAYETKYGMWVLEDDIRVTEFIRVGGDMYMLQEGGKFYLTGAGDSEAGIEWHIQFAPFYETISGQKSYSRIVMRLELLQGSHIGVDVRTDGGAWREAGKVVGKRDGIVPVMIPINRCDKFEVRLRGKGKATIHSMVREFFVGGDK